MCTPRQLSLLLARRYIAIPHNCQSYTCSIFLQLLKDDLQIVLNVILGIFGRKDAPLYLTMKKKIPKKAPWGEEPGRDLGEEASPLYVRIMDLSVK